MDAVVEFCEEGGGILLLEGARKWACSSELWGRFGLHKERFPLSLDNPIKMPSIDLPLRLPYGKFEAEFIHHPITMGMYKKIRMVNPCWVKGGLPIAFVNQRPVISYKEFGKGRIIAIGDDRIFAGFIVEKEDVIDRNYSISCGINHQSERKIIFILAFIIEL